MSAHSRTIPGPTAAVNRVVLDAAVRAFRDRNPMRWPCACFGCAATIMANYRGMLALAGGASASITGDAVSAKRSEAKGRHKP
jgi:hypothetical protein